MEGQKAQRVVVGWLDIFFGRRGSPSRCMVARAAARAFKRRKEFAVTVSPEPVSRFGQHQDYGKLPWRIWLREGSYEIPEAAVSTIHEWEFGRRVRPFSFELGAAGPTYNHYTALADAEDAFIQERERASEAVGV
jgi:hypothetical protein